jgi:hypothetical protein
MLIYAMPDLGYHNLPAIDLLSLTRRTRPKTTIYHFQDIGQQPAYHNRLQKDAG